MQDQKVPQETPAQIEMWKTLNTMLAAVAEHDYAKFRPSVLVTPVGPVQLYYIEIDGDCFVEVALYIPEMDGAAVGSGHMELAGRAPVPDRKCSPDNWRSDDEEAEADE